LSERTNLTDILLLTVLAGILLVSGSLQCAFDCLTRVDGMPSAALFVTTDRVNSCHTSIESTAPEIICLNKACHQRLPLQRDLGGPAIYRLEKLAQPLFSSSRQLAPLFRASDEFTYPPPGQETSADQSLASKTPVPTTHFSIRTTVLLC
jgi:hypothetical protein